jgi:succinate dehydrogenase hydrophobic anchor subunit
MTAPIPARRFPGRPETAPPGFVPGVEDLQPTIEELRAPTRAGAWWLVKAVSGVLLVVFLGMHLVAQHFLVPGGLRDFASVVSYLRNPIALTAELGLLAAVATHAALGVRAVLVDVLPSAVAVRRASWVLGAGAVIAFGYGVALTQAVIGS